MPNLNFTKAVLARQQTKRST